MMQKHKAKRLLADYADELLYQIKRNDRATDDELAETFDSLLEALKCLQFHANVFRKAWGYPVYIVPCPKCGTNELLCGHGGCGGCSHE